MTGYRCLALLVNYMQNSNAFEASAGSRGRASDLAASNWFLVVKKSYLHANLDAFKVFKDKKL